MFLNYNLLYLNYECVIWAQTFREVDFQLVQHLNIQVKNDANFMGQVGLRDCDQNSFYMLL